MKARVPAGYGYLLLAAAAGTVFAGFSAEILLPSADGATLQPDDTLELRLRADGDTVSDRVSISAWVLDAGAAEPAVDVPSPGRAQVWPSPTVPGEWLVHLRGLKAPEEKTGGRRWDLLLRWRFADGRMGQSRLKGVLSFRSDLPDVVLLLDSSDSMGLNDPNRLRVEAARTFLVMALRSGGIGRVAVVQFASKVRVLLPLTPVQETDAFVRALQDVRESGMTDIDGSLRAALDLLGKGARENPPAVVLLTDGKQEPGEYREAHKDLAAAGVPVHTVALGKSADRILLRRISEDTGGTFSDAARDQDLLRLYGAIASRIAGGRRILQKSLPAAGGACEFPVDGACRLLTVTASDPGSLELATAGGDVYAGREEPHPVTYVSKPPVGSWRVRYVASQAGERESTLESMAHTPLYPLFFRSKVERGAPVEIDADDPWLACSLGEEASVYPAEVHATVAWGDAAPMDVVLQDDGRHGDGVAGDGIFAGSLPEAARPEPGARGTIRLVAIGQRATGETFRREIDGVCVARRGGVRQLLTSGPLDFGERWLGEAAEVDVSLRVRGAGGRLRVKILRDPAEMPGADAAHRSALAAAGGRFDDPVSLTFAGEVRIKSNAGLAFAHPSERASVPDVELRDVPTDLRPREAARFRFRIALPPDARAGLYSGRIEVDLEGEHGQPPVHAGIPWQVVARRPQLSSDPAWLNLGRAQPGDVLTATVRLATSGGRVRIQDVQFCRVMEPPTGGEDGTSLRIREAAAGPLEISPEGRTVTVELRTDRSARFGGRLWAVTLYPAYGGAYEAFSVQSEVVLQWLKQTGTLDFGQVEAGDHTARRLDFVLTDGHSEHAVPVDIRLESPQQDLRADWVNELAGRGELTLRTGREAKGPRRGQLNACSGPAWLRGEWNVDVIRPGLGIEPPEVDLGACFPGRTLRGQFTAALRGARAADVDLSLDDPPRKPAVQHVWMSNSVVGLPVNRCTLEPGVAQDWPLEVRVPDGAQDGEYRLRLRVDSRLGRQSVTARFRVNSPVPLPLFHISPADVTLQVARDGSPFPVDLTIASHVDRELRVTARVRPDGEGTAVPAELLADGSDAVSELTFMLPPRAELGLQVQGRATSRDGDACRILFSAEDEEQSVSATVRRSRVPDTAGLTVESRTRYNWMRWMVFLLLLLLVLLILSLAKRKWVRYATCALLVHAAVMLIAVPPSTVVRALPPSVQLTLLGQSPEEVAETSPEQARRIRELPSVVALKEQQQPQDMEARSALSAPEIGKGPEASEPKPPLAPAELAQASAQVAPTRIELKPPERAHEQDALDAALQLDAPRAPSPEPVAPGMEMGPAPAQATLIATPSPVSPAAPDLPRNTFVPEVNAPLQQAATQAERREVPAPLLTAATRIVAATEDLPLSVEPAQNPTSDVASVSPQKGLVEERAMPVGAATASLLAQPVLARVPTGGANDQVRPDAVAHGSLTPEAEWTRLVHGTGTGGAQSGTYERDAGAPGTGHGDLPMDLGTGQGLARNGQGHGQGPLAPAGRLRPAGSGMPTATGIGALGAPMALGGGLGAVDSGTVGGSGGTGAAVARLGGRLLSGRTGNGDGAALPEMARGGGRNGTGDSPLDLGSTGPGTVRRDGEEGQGGGGRAPNGPRLPAGAGRWTGATGGLGGPKLDGLSLGNATPVAARVGAARSELGAQLDSLALERAAQGRSAPMPSARGIAGIRPLWGAANSTAIHIRLGLAKHGGDWDSSPTALLHLASAFRERCGLPALEVTVKNVPLSDAAAMSGCALVLVTSNDPIPWKPAELEAMRAYMASGGMVWVNDSSATGDERFDRGFQAILPQVCPGAQLRRLEWDHPLFTAAYDLTRGYKGYPLPPGDKYREEFARGIRVNVKGQSRVALLYTRNDYADGMEIDPRSIAGMKSLTDLAPDEMLEGALRFGINTLAYALGSDAPRMPPPPESAAEIARLYRYQGPPLPIFDDLERNAGEDGTPIWSLEEWGNAGAVSLVRGDSGQELRVAMQGGEKVKVVASRLVALDLSDARAIVLDLHSGLQEGFNAALLFSVKPDWVGYETRPLFIRPGWNRNLRFPLTLDDFKTSSNDWKEYNAAFHPRADVARLSVLLYNLHVDGEVRIDNLRIER